MVAYRNRERYRKQVVDNDLISFGLSIGETDLMILADRDYSEIAREALLAIRMSLQAYVAREKEFLTALLPLEPHPPVPPVAERMLRAASAAGVGPMAAVAGAIADCLGEELLRHSRNVIIENGGDIFMRSDAPRTVAIYHGEEGSFGRLGIRIASPAAGLGVCTSSAEIGPSLSLGKARIATVVASSAGLADAVATGLGNRVREPGDLTPALEWALGIEGVSGALAMRGESLGAVGMIDLVQWS